MNANYKVISLTRMRIEPSSNALMENTIPSCSNARIMSLTGCFIILHFVINEK